MEPKKKMNVSGPGVAGTANNHAPRKMTFAENVILTVKVLVITALIMAVLWGATQWTSQK